MIDSDTEYLQHHTPFDALLKEPLDLYGGRARRLDQIRALMRGLDLSHREFAEHRISESSLALLFRMIPLLAETREDMRVDVRGRCVQITALAERPGGRSTITPDEASRAIVDWGWGHSPVNGGTIHEVRDRMVDLYVEHMSENVCRMLRVWENRGWLSDVAA